MKGLGIEFDHKRQILGDDVIVRPTDLVIKRTIPGRYHSSIGSDMHAAWCGSR